MPDVEVEVKQMEKDPHHTYNSNLHELYFLSEL